MITFEPCTVHTAMYFKPQPAQYDEWREMLARGWFVPELSDLALSAWADGRPVAMAGIYRNPQNQGTAWALLGIGSGKHLLTIARKMKQTLAMYPLGRVEMLVDQTFERGHRFAKLVGMQLDEQAGVMYGWQNRPLSVYMRPNDDDRHRDSSDWLIPSG